MRQKAQVLEAGLLEDVRSNESVRRLAANPLMLTMLALLRRQVGRLPHRRVQLYESYVGTLLENWVDARSEGAREQSLSILDRHQAENILIPLAFWLQQEKPSGTAGRAEIRRKLVEICLVDRGIIPAQAERSTEKEAEEQADRFLREMRQMAGLLIERGHDAFGFLHLTFQEYFAGRALAQLGDQERWEAIRPHLHDPRWREPILLCAGRLGVVENRRPQVTQLVRDILGNEDPTEADLHRNLLLALAITCDDVNLEPTLIGELAERAISLLATPIHALARDLVRLFGQLVANGMASFEACLPSIEQAEVYRKGLVIEELGRFAEVKDIGLWLRGQLDSDEEWIVAAALEALTSQMVEPLLWQKAIARLGSWNTGSAASHALTRIVKSNAEVRQGLLEAVEHRQNPSQLFALHTLAGLVKTDIGVRNVLLMSLHNSDINVRLFAVQGLSSLVTEDMEAREAVLEVARSEGYAIVSLINALAGVIGEDGEVRRITLEFLTSRDPEGRYPAVRALSRILGSDQEAFSRVMDLLSAEGGSSGLLESLKLCLSSVSEICQVFHQKLAVQDWRARQVAYQALIDAGSVSFEDLAMALHFRESLEAMAALVSCAELSATRLDDKWREFWWGQLKHPEPQYRSAAIIALKGLACISEEIRWAVLDRLRDNDYRVRRSALSASSRIVGAEAEVRRAVLDWLEDGNFVRGHHSALSALSEVVGADAEVRRAVLDRLNDETQEVRQSALLALSGVVGADAEVRRVVLDRLDNDSYGVRQSALLALSGVVGVDAEVRRVVLDRLDDDSYGIRQSALRALSGVVGADAEVRRAVLDRLNDDSYGIRQSALSALSGVVGTDAEACQAILDRLDDKYYGVRLQAVHALAPLLQKSSVRQAILQKLEDPDFPVRLQVVEVVAQSGEEALFESLSSRLTVWLGVDANVEYGNVIYNNVLMVRSVQAQLAKRFGAQLPTDPSLRDHLLEQLGEARWSSRLGAALTLLAWSGGPPDEILARVLAALEDRRGLEAYPAQLTAAAALINQNDYAAEAIDLCLEALDYGMQPWEDLYSSPEVRKQAALVLGKLEPVFYDSRIYDKLLHVLHNDEDDDVRDAAYGTLVRLARIRDQQLC